AIVLQTSFVAASCGASNGSASVVTTGGSAPYTYTWTPAGGTSASASNLPAGAYTVTVTDGNSCTQSSVVNVSNAGGPTVVASVSQNVSCFGGSNGSASVNV